MFGFIKKNTKNIFIKNFNFCFFVSLCILSVFPHGLTRLPIAVYIILYWVLPLVSGLVSALILLSSNRRLATRKYIQKYHVADQKLLFAVAFLSGFMSAYITVSPLYTYIISIVIIFVAVTIIKDFIIRLKELLDPQTAATPQTICDFFNFLINMLISFTVINLSLNTAHIQATSLPAFNFGHGVSYVIDAFYFSIITLATVGYGDIVPQTPAARLVVSLECLTGYLLLAVMIGIVTRGIDFGKQKDGGKQ